MNCRQIRKRILRGPKRERPETEMGRQMREHARSCPKCASRLEEEDTLAFALEALVKELEHECAPPHLEYRLVEAFERSKWPPETSGTENHEPWLTRLRFSEVLAAAALVAALGITLTAWQRSGGPQYEQFSAQTGRAVETEGADTGLQRPQPPELAGLGDRYRYEINTDFIDLGGFHGSDSWDGAQLFRVHLPRSSLLLFGLPMNTSLAEEKIPADVLVGEDGVPRAIRFVYSTDLDRIH
jgi:hypothetical protein